MNHAQNARQALSEGIIAGAVDHVQQAELPKLSSAICDALVNRREDINQAYRGTGDTERARALGFVVAGILTMPQIKIGDRRKPTNVQLVQEVTNQVLCEDNNLEISVALGGSEQPPSLRLVSYVSPMLEIGSLFARQHLPVPTLRVVAAHAVSSTLNGLDAKRAHERANQATTIIDRLVEMYYPECRSSVVFEHLEVDELQEKGHDKDTAYLLEILEGEDDSPTEVTSSLVKLLARATKRHASGRDAQEHASVLAGYGAAHGLSFHNYRYPSVTSAIKIGGAGESPFNTIQQHMTERAVSMGEHVVNINNGKPVLVNLESRAGTIPPYYLESEGEITVDTPLAQIPTVEGVINHYRERALRSGIDFTHLPSRLLNDHHCLQKLRA